MRGRRREIEMRLPKGTPVMLVGEILKDAQDARTESEKGYVVRTDRGDVFADPHSLLIYVSDIPKKEEK